jgi:hypothetical protein
MIYAIYRGLYGEDFVEASVNSITDAVDHIFFCLDYLPWGDVDGYEDRVRGLAISNPKVSILYDHAFNNISQFTRLVNERILPYCKKPDTIMVIESDQVFRADQFRWALAEFHESGADCAMTRQVEVWKGFKHAVPERPNRTGVVFWDMRSRDGLPPTMRQAEPAVSGLRVCRTKAFVHNLGFAISPELMFWKHMIALGMSQKIGDSRPNEMWYENVWLPWTPEMRNLEISLGHETDIPIVFPYPEEELPEEIRKVLG